MIRIDYDDNHVEEEERKKKKKEIKRNESEQKMKIAKKNHKKHIQTLRHILSQAEKKLKKLK